jgi:hypothetical protein
MRPVLERKFAMKRNLRSLIIPGLAGLFLTAGTALGADLLVPSQYGTIQAAMDAAQAGDRVLVSPGTYHDCTHPTEGPESTPACVIMKSGVTLRGDGVATEVIIDAQGAGRGIFIEDVSDCAVENLTVTGAFADIYGAGILVRQVDSSVAVTDVRVDACTDGGIICINSASPTISGTIMSNNVAKQGGGLAIEENSSPVVLNCRVTGNQAPSGAGIFIRSGCSPTLDGVTVDGNTITASYGNGGGICVQAATPTIRNCNIYNNVTLGYGGGVAYVSGGGGTMTDCYIAGNDAAGTYSLGGGVATSQSDPVLRNLVIAQNTATGFYAEGGGLDISFAPAPTVENCTIADNSTSPNGYGGGISVQWGVTPVITHCIITGAVTGQGIYCAGATPTVTCTNIWNNAGGDDLCGTDGGGNFSADPLFCDTVERPYNLQEGSPCAPGNHPDGGCDGLLIGGAGTGCGSSPAGDIPGPALVLGNLPNPFNPRTEIFFELPEAGSARLRIFDLAGRLITEKTWSSLPAGVRHNYQWNGQDRHGRAVTSGVYFYRLDSRHHSISKRMSLIR